MMLKSFVLFDSACSKGRRPNLSLMMLTLTLALVSLISCDIEINSKNFKKFEIGKIDENLQGHFEETDKYLNFRKGDWYYVANSQANKDGRIFEFHPDISSAPNFLNDYHSQTILFQASLSRYLQPLVFFESKLPLITYSIAMSENSYKVTPEDVEKYVSKLYKRNPKILNLLNKFPYFNVALTNSHKSFLFNNILQDLQKSLESEIKNSKDLTKMYSIPLKNDNPNIFMKNIITMFIDIGVTQEVFYLGKPSYKNSNEKTDNYRNSWYKINQIVLNLMENLVSNEELRADFVKLYYVLRHYMLRYLHIYFFNENSYFLENLFEAHIDGQSTLNSLFESLTTFFKAKKEINVIDAYDDNFLNSYNYSFDHYFQILDKENSLNQEQKMNEYKKKLKIIIGELLKNIVSKLKSILNKIINLSKLEEIQFTNISELETIFKLYTDQIFMPTFEKFTDVVKRGFMNLKIFENDEIFDLNDPYHLSNFRRELVMIGKLEFNEAIDRKYVANYEYEIFKVKKNRLVI